MGAHARPWLRDARQRIWLQQRPANAAEDAAELAAQKAAEMAVELDDSDNGSTSDVRSPTASPAKKKTRSARGRGRQ